MYTTTVQVPKTVMVDVELTHRFQPGDVVFPVRTPEDRDERIVEVYQYVTMDGEPTEGLMYRFEGRPGSGTYGRSVEWVDKHYVKARP